LSNTGMAVAWMANTGMAAARVAGAGMIGIRSVPPYDCHRHFAVLHEPPPVHAALDECAAAATTLRRLLSFAIGARSGPITIQTECPPHLLFGIVHRRCRRG